MIATVMHPSPNPINLCNLLFLQQISRKLPYFCQLLYPFRIPACGYGHYANLARVHKITVAWSTFFHVAVVVSHRMGSAAEPGLPVDLVRRGDTLEDRLKRPYVTRMTDERTERTVRLRHNPVFLLEFEEWLGVSTIPSISWAGN